MTSKMTYTNVADSYGRTIIILGSIHLLVLDVKLGFDKNVPFNVSGLVKNGRFLAHSCIEHDILYPTSK